MKSLNEECSMNDLANRFRKEIEELVEASQRSAELGFVTSHGGNLSYRVEEDVILITPTKVLKRKVGFSDICAVNLKGETLFAGEGRRPTGETPMHIRFFSKRPDINGVVHAHPPILTGFSISDHWSLLTKPLLPEPVIEVGPMVLVDYAEPVSDALAEKFDRVLHKSNGFLMKNHGVIFVSTQGVLRALDLLEMMEYQAHSVLVAQTIGRVDEIPRDEVDNMERTLRKRDMPIPGDPRVIKKLTDLYY
jgi:L-fuculose-phosphate aldolase